MVDGAQRNAGITLSAASIKDTVIVLKVLEIPLSSSSTEGFTRWMLQRDLLVNPVQAMDLEKVQAAGQELLALTAGCLCLLLFPVSMALFFAF